MSFANIKRVTQADAKEAIARKNQGTEGRNIALRVTSYDVAKNTTTGINILTGDEEEIGMRPQKNKETARPRAEVLDWSGAGKNGTRNKSYTEIGGVIVFEAVFAYPEGLIARWGKSYSHTPTEAEIFIAPACPFISAKGKLGMEVLKTGSAKKVSTVDELTKAISDCLSANTFTSAMVRLLGVNDDGVEEVIAIRDDRKNLIGRSKYVEGKYIILTADEAAKEFLKTKYGEMLVSDIGTDFITEVIGVDRIFAGTDTQESLSKKDFNRFYRIKGTQNGFTDTIMACRRHSEGGLFFSAEPLPISTQPKLYAMDDLPTEFIQPKVIPFVSRQIDDSSEMDSDAEKSQNQSLMASESNTAASTA
jgi:hypothetical protein